MGGVLSYIILKLFKSLNIYILSIVLVMSIILDHFDVIIPVLRFTSGDMLATFFVSFGIYYKRTGYKVEDNAVIILPAAVLLVILGTLYWRGCVPIIDTWKIVPYAVTAIVATLAVYSVSKLIDRKNKLSGVLIYIGNHTLQILTWHFLLFRVVTLSIITIYDENLSHLSDFPVYASYAKSGWWMVYFVFSIVVTLFVNSVYDKAKCHLAKLSI